MNILCKLAVSAAAAGLGFPLLLLALGVSEISTLGTVGAIGAVAGLIAGAISGALNSERIETHGYYTRTYGNK